MSSTGFLLGFEMKKYLPYFQTSIFLKANGADTEPVDFIINNDDCFEIKREETFGCDENPEEFPEIEGFYVAFSIDEAIRLRDFLNHALPVDYFE